MISEIDWHNQELIIRGEISKNKKTQRVAITNVFMQKIEQMEIRNYPGSYYIFGRSCPSDVLTSRDHFSKRFRKVLDKLGIGKGYSMYSWKHTMNQRAAIKGIPLKTIQIQNKHHSLDQLSAYLKGLTIRDVHLLFTDIPDL